MALCALTYFPLVLLQALTFTPHGFIQPPPLYHVDVILTKTPSRLSTITPAAVAVVNTQEGEAMMQCKSSMLRFF